MARTLADAGFTLDKVPRGTSRSWPDATRLALLWVVLTGLLALNAILVVKLVEARRLLRLEAPAPAMVGPLRGGVTAPPPSVRRVWLPAGQFSAGQRLKAWVVVEEER